MDPSPSPIPEDVKRFKRKRLPASDAHKANEFNQNEPTHRRYNLLDMAAIHSSYGILRSKRSILEYDFVLAWSRGHAHGYESETCFAVPMEVTKLLSAYRPISSSHVVPRMPHGRTSFVEVLCASLDS